MMVDDNPVSWLVLLVLAICVAVYIFKEWYNSKPKSYWTSRDNFGCVSSVKQNVDWGSNSKRKRFF